MSDGDKSQYKDTLNLPKTEFDMRAGLLAKEPAMQQAWQAEDLYGQIRRARAGRPRFILHDGPPYANGDIHMGTALNKVLKDIVVRCKNMTGFDAPYVPGWDCHGLPIESRVQQDLKEEGVELTRLPQMDIRRRCAGYAARFQKAQSDQFQRLGVLGEFGRPYTTMSPRYEAATLEVLAALAEQGLVFKALKPVHWSIENRTALADAELEYEDREDTSIYVLFHLAEGDKVKAALKIASPAELSLMIWTTTPWTLPGNLAVAVHPDFEYSAIRYRLGGQERLAVVASELVAKMAQFCELGEVETLARARGQALVEMNLRYRQPLIEGRLCPVVPAPYVTLEDGTGLVHTAPGHGLEDYGTALRCRLEVYCPVQGDGTFDATAPAWLVGKSVWQANPLVVEFLRKAGALVKAATIVHSYPHDWRSKTPTIFRATEQWFVGVDRAMQRGTTLRDMAMEACRRPADDGGIDFVPAWGRNRLAGMLQTRPDWCISRQRTWGLPIPAFYNQGDEVLLTPASIRAVARHFAQHGSDSWFTDEPAKILAGYDPAADPEVKNPAAFAPAGLRKGGDILDVWFESGSSWSAVAVQRGLVKAPPVDLYLEGADQHRGWFQLSLLPGLGAAGVPPFRTLLTHGWVMDEAGRKMSKSLGNYIAALDQLGKRGADILRLWVASQDYQDDIRCSEKLIAQADDAYRKIRNTLRYCMGACNDFNPARDAATPDKNSLAGWMRIELHRLVRDVRQAYDAYEFHKAMRLMYEFCTVQASSIFMAAVKDRLYCDLPDSPRRRQTQTVLHEMLMALVKLLAPVLPHTCQEAWEMIPHRPAAEPASVHLALLPEPDRDHLAAVEALPDGEGQSMTFQIDSITPSQMMVWNRILDLRAKGLVKMEALRNAGVKNSLDAEAVFTVSMTDAPASAFVETYLPELEDLLGVGYARIEKVAVPAPAEEERISVRVEDARQKYQRCARSWKRRPDVGSDLKYPDLSARDAAAVRALRP